MATEFSSAEPTPLLPSYWFGQMSDEMSSRLIPIAVARKLRSGEYLYRSGEVAEGFYYIEQGRVRLGALFASREYTIAHAGAGDWLGEVPMLDGLPHVSDAQAVTACRLLLVSRRRLEVLLEQEPRLYRHLARRLALAMRLSLAYYGDLAALPLTARLAKRLLELSLQYGESDEDGVRIGLRLPQQLLADMLATSRQSISKELKALETRGWISLKYNTVCIREPQALKRLVQPEPA